LIHRAAEGDWLPFANVVVRPSPAPAYTLALGSYLTIACSESIPFMNAQEITEQTAGTFSGDYRVRTYQLACDQWPRGNVRGDFLLPVESQVPVLMLSGDLDPVAPLHFARDAARHLANSRQVLLRNTAHNYTSPCVRALTVAFVAKGAVDNLDVACAERMRRPRFLTELPERYQR
jgi:pimeloyl-ACP methyl ester carboxylesterase